MHCSQGMLKSCMQSSGINQWCKSQLSDAAKSLKKRMFYNVKCKFIGYSNKSMNRIVEYFSFIGCSCAHLFRIFVLCRKTLQLNNIIVDQVFLTYIKNR